MKFPYTRIYFKSDDKMIEAETPTYDALTANLGRQGIRFLSGTTRSGMRFTLDTEQIQSVIEIGSKDQLAKLVEQEEEMNDLYDELTGRNPFE